MTALVLGSLMMFATPALAHPDDDVELRELIEAHEEDIAELRLRLAEQQRELDRLHKHKRAPSKSVSAASGKVTVAANQVVHQAVAYGNDVVVAGEVTGDATAFGGDVVVINGGVVGGSAVALGGEVHLAPGGLIHGEQVAFSLAPPATVSAAGALPEQRGLLASFAANVYSKLIWFLCLAGAGVLTVGLAPQRVGRVATRVAEHPIRSMFLGAFVSGFIGLSALLFAITILGLPVSFLLVSVMGLAWLLGFVGLSQAIGDHLPMRERVHGRWLAFLAGALCVTFFSVLPWVGSLVIVGAGLTGVGAAFGSRFGGR
jgi:hypothetical protein